MILEAHKIFLRIRIQQHCTLQHARTFANTNARKVATLNLLASKLYTARYQVLSITLLKHCLYQSLHRHAGPSHILYCVSYVHQQFTRDLTTSHNNRSGDRFSGIPLLALELAAGVTTRITIRITCTSSLSLAVRKPAQRVYGQTTADAWPNFCWYSSKIAAG